jgi:hypothetical protein
LPQVVTPLAAASARENATGDLTRPCAKVEPLVSLLCRVHQVPLHGWVEPMVTAVRSPGLLRWQFIEVMSQLANRTDCRNQAEVLQLVLKPALLGTLDEVQRAKGKMKAVFLNRLETFGPAAAPVVPQLVTLLESEETQWGAIAVLATIGPPAAAAATSKLQQLVEGDIPSSTPSARALAHIGITGRVVLPKLLRLLRADDNDCRQAWARHRAFAMPAAELASLVDDELRAQTMKALVQAQATCPKPVADDTLAAAISLLDKRPTH